jgi:hypothetical protein
VSHEFHVGFPPLAVVIRMTCSDRLVHDRIAARFAVAGGVAAALTMAVSGPSPGGDVVGSVHVEAVPHESGYTVSFAGSVPGLGSVSSPTYFSELGPLEHDAYTVVLTVLQTALLPRAMVAVHAAFVDVDGAGVLVAGPSGAGKSTTAFAALTRGFPVHSGEISIVGDGWLKLGESSVAVASGAIERWGLSVLPSAERRGGGWVFPLPELPEPRRIDAVVFPRVHAGGCSHERVPYRSAQVLAFECVTSQAPVWRMVGNRTETVRIPWDTSASVISIEQAFRLCDVPTWHVEGTPADIAACLTDLVARKPPDRGSRT